MGWWMKRSTSEFETLSGGRWSPESGHLEFPDGKAISRNLLWDLPRRIEGKEALMKMPVIEMLEDAFPGIHRCLYYWDEPRSRGELIGEMLSSWPGVPRHEAQKPEEDG